MQPLDDLVTHSCLAARWTHAWWQQQQQQQAVAELTYIP
jgi:hypothetical protein